MLTGNQEGGTSWKSGQRRRDQEIAGNRHGATRKPHQAAAHAENFLISRKRAACFMNSGRARQLREPPEQSQGSTTPARILLETFRAEIRIRHLFVIYMIPFSRDLLSRNCVSRYKQTFLRYTLRLLDSNLLEPLQKYRVPQCHYFYPYCCTPERIISSFERYSFPHTLTFLPNEPHTSSVTHNRSFLLRYTLKSPQLVGAIGIPYLPPSSNPRLSHTS